jgi:hypothetical protein
MKTDEYLSDRNLKFCVFKGFIGKVFHTNDLDALVNFFLIFSSDKPIDWLLDKSVVNK